MASPFTNVIPTPVTDGQPKVSVREEGRPFVDIRTVTIRVVGDTPLLMPYFWAKYHNRQK